jgi:hypothetical protein
MRLGRYFCNHRLTGHSFGHDPAAILTGLSPRNHERNPEQSTEYQNDNYYWRNRSKIRHCYSHP